MEKGYRYIGHHLNAKDWNRLVSFWQTMGDFYFTRDLGKKEAFWWTCSANEDYCLQKRNEMEKAA